MQKCRHFTFSFGWQFLYFTNSVYKSLGKNVYIKIKRSKLHIKIADKPLKQREEILLIFWNAA